MTEIDFQVKIIDYGLACILPKGEFADEACGTIEVIAPEALKPGSDHRVDVWGLGLVCYMLFTSECMFSSMKELLDGRWCTNNLECSIEFLRFINETV